MERRQFLSGLLGVAGAAALAAALPKSAHALGTDPVTDGTPQEGGILPELKAASEETVSAEGVEVAQHHHGRRHGPPPGHHRRRRRRIRRRHFRRVCRRYRNRWGHWVRRCRREPYWAWIWI